MRGVKMECDEKLLIELYEGDEKLKDIAAKLNIHISSISRKIKKLIEIGKVESRMAKMTRKKEVIKNKVEKLCKKGYKYEEISQKLEVNVNSIGFYALELKEEGRLEGRNNKPVIISKENVEDITYKHPKLEVGKSYKFNELDSSKRIKSNSDMKGKIIAEFDNFYRLDRGKYIECINKSCMMDLIIKESVNGDGRYFGN